MEAGKPIVTAFKINAKKGKKSGVEATYTRPFVTETQGIVNVDNPGQLIEVTPHPDLVALFAKLSPHYALLTEREDVDETNVEDPATVERLKALYPCGSIQFKSGTNWVGVQFHGHKVLSTGHACNSLTRLVKFNSNNPDYPLADDLEALVDAIRDEVVLLIDGKQAEPAQKAMEFPGGDGGDGGEAGDGDNGGE